MNVSRLLVQRTNNALIRSFLPRKSHQTYHRIRNLHTTPSQKEILATSTKKNQVNYHQIRNLHTTLSQKEILANIKKKSPVKTTITDPEIVAIPTVMRIKSSLLVIVDKYGFIKRGASTCPKIILAVALKPTGPPTFRGFLNKKAKAFTKKGITLQCQRIADRADITITRVNPPNTKIKVFEGSITSNGALGAPSAK